MSLFKIFASQPPEEDKQAALEAKERESRDKLAQANAKGPHQPPKFDAVAVLEAAGVKEDQRTRVARTLELLKSLPDQTPAAVRKSIVEASLKAFDISIKAIVEAAANEITAFDNFIAHGHKQLDQLRKESEDRIAQLKAEIARIEDKLDLATADQASLDQATLEESGRVRPILQFFAGEASPPAKVANDSKNGHPPSIIIDDSLTKAG